MSSARGRGSRPSFGKYRPIAVLGRGGMATVYLAAATGPGGFTKLVVVKELKPDLAEEEQFRAMFLEEAKLAARLHHPNIVQTFEVVDEDDLPFLVMEYLEGQSLHGLRAKPGAFGDAVVTGQVRIMADVLAGLHAAHELVDYDGQPLKVVHRDVSPHNTFVTYEGEVKLVDFGIAKAVDSTPRTSTGAIKGKLAYMPPEQAFGLGVDRRADVFAAGVMLWEAVAGARMWKGLTEPVVLGRLAQGKIPRVEEVVPHASAELVRILSRALEPQPENRYPTAAAFQEDLERYLRTLPHAPSSREVGAAAGRAFAEQRAEVRRIVDEQLRQARAEGTGDRSLPRLPSMVPPASTPSVASQEGTRSSAVVTHDIGKSPRPDRTSLLVALVASAVAVVAVTVATVVLWRSPTPAAVTSASSEGSVADPARPPPPRPSATAAAVATAENPPPAPMARLTIVARPKTAKVALDGNPVEGDPHVIRVSLDGAAHRVHVEAQGFLSYDETIKLDGDRQLEVTLHRPPSAGAKPGKANAEDDIGF